MPDGPTTCPRCGAPLTESTRGLCPRCTWRQALSSGEGTPEPCDDVDLAFLSEHDPDQSSESHPSRRSFAGYQIEGELGRGGMSVVYAAVQPEVNRRVALKLLSAPVSRTSADALRFHNEVEAASQLDHPSILPVYEFGEHDGQWFYTMRLAEGGNLAEHIPDFWIRVSDLSPGPGEVKERQRRIAELILQLSRAVAYAHQRGILHRDLKPANILLDAVGTAYVSDFGLAKFMEEDRGLTLTQGIVGTPGYMAPEQASGRKGEVTTATDVYGLGTILYELLTGQAPFRGESSVETLRRVVEEEVTPPHRLCPHVDRDLETICLKSLAKEPSRRYPTAQTLAEDLERWLAGEPIAARPVSTGEGLWLWARRKPAVAALTLAVTIVFILGFLSTWWQWRRAVQRAEESRRNLYAAEVNLARQAADDGDWGRAHELLARQIPEPGQRDLRGWEWRHLRRVTRGDDLFHFPVQEGGIHRALFLPGNNTIVSAGPRTLGFWDLPSRECLASFGQSADIRGLEVTSDGRLLFVGSLGNSLDVWELNPTPTLRSTHATGQIWGMALSPDDRLLAVTERREVRVLRVPHLQEVLALPTDSYGKMIFEGLAFTPNSRAFAYHQGNGVIRVIDLDTGEQIALLQGHNGWVQDLCYSSDGTVLVSAGSDGTIRIWDTSRQQTTVVLTEHIGWVGSVEFSPDGMTLASAGADHTIVLWNTGDWSVRHTLRGQESEVWGLGFSEDGRLLVTGGKDHTVRVWSVSEESEPAVESRVLPRGPWLASADASSWLTEAEGSGFSRIDSLSLKTEPLLKASPLNASTGTALAFTADTLATLPAEGRIALLDLKTSREKASIPAPDAPLLGGDFSVDGRHLALVTVSNTVEVWRTDPPEQILSFQPTNRIQPSGIIGRAFSADGRLLAVSFTLFPNGGTVLRIWRLTGREPGMRVLDIPASHTQGLAFSSDGRILATASNDAAIRLFRVADGRQLATLLGQKVSFHSVGFSIDGTRLAGGGADGSIVIWDVNSFPPREFMRIKRPGSWNRVAFLAQDQALVALGDHQGEITAYVWRAAPPTDEEGAPGGIP